MKKFLQATLLLGFLFACSSDDEEPMPDLDAPAATGIRVDDITNNGNGSDLEVRFNKGADETLISEYRVFAVKKAESSSFNLTAAENVPNGNYLPVAPNGNNQVVTFSASGNDSGGQPIVEGVEYVVYVLSMADGTNAVNNTLSSPSAGIKLQVTTIKITYIGNDGVHISDGSKSVIIDALPGNLDGWYAIATGVQAQIEQGSGDFAGISVAMVTHNHGDHVSPNSVNRFLNSNGSATLIAPPDVASSISNTGQISAANPDLNQFEDVVIDGIPIRVMHMMHFNAFGNDFSSVINFSYLVEIGGLKVLHLGDFKYSTANLQAFDLLNENIDIVIIPALTPFLNSTSKAVIDDHIDPGKVIAIHLLSSTTASQVTAVYPDADVFTNSLDFKRY